MRYASIGLLLMGLVMWTGGTATGAPEDEPSPVDKTNDQNQDRGVSDSKKETDQENSGSSEAAGRFNPVVRKMQGWTIYIEPALIDGKHGKRGRRALAMLRDHLRRIRVLMPDDRLKMLRQLDIWIEHNHPEFRSLQYHPKVNWLKKNGYDPRLAKKVHIPRAKTLLSRHQMIKHPWVVLHELAHAYHDQYLGFDDPRIKKAYRAAKKAGIYEKVLLYTGQKTRHYGLTNHKEYFAEGTEAYVARNDFYPFVRAELKQHDPRLHKLMKEIWGPMP